MQNTHKNGHALKVVGTRNGRGPWIAALMLLSLAVVPAALSQNNPLTVLATFNRTNGADPQGNLTLIGSTLYGVTGYGGAHNAGAVFSMSRSGGSPTVVASFDGANGSGTWAGLTRKGTILYGTTGKGGLYGYGTVFSVPATGGNITVLASFNGVNGKTPMGGLTLSGNTLYGTTVFGGGAKELGTVFSVPTQGGKITVLASLRGAIVQ